LPSTFIEPQEIETVLSDPSNPIHRKSIYVCVFRKKDIFENKETKGFEEIEYKMNPERYRSTFHEKYLSKCTIIFNCLLWDIRYPRVVSSDQLKAAWLGGGCRLNAIGDLTSDLEGSFEMSKKFSETDSHFFIWDPVRQIVIDDVNKSEKGILYLNSDNLATEFPSDSSKVFSHDLLPFLSPVAHSDIALHPEKADLPPPMLNATMVWNGALLPKYAYINRVREQFSQAHESFKAEVKPKITRNGQGDYELALRFTGHLFDSRFIIAFMNTLEQQTEGTVSSEFLGWDVRMNQWEKSTLRLRFRSGWISNILRAVEEIRRLAVPANIEIHFEK
jgi:alpha-aminoadipic semialdehyde synthase